MLNRLRMRARVGMGAALLAVPLAVGQVTVGHAALGTWTCVADVSWTTPNTTSLVTTPGTLVDTNISPSVPACVTTDLSRAPFISVNTVSGAGFTLGYWYTGNCAVGALQFANGSVGVFVGGVLAVAGGGLGATVAVGVPTILPCAGGTDTYSGVAVEAGVHT